MCSLRLEWFIKDRTVLTATNPGPGAPAVSLKTDRDSVDTINLYLD